MVMLYSQLFVTPPLPTASFEGQTIIVTGANVGLGKEAARHFARLKAAKLILAVRNTAAGEEAKADIINTTSCDDPSSIEVWHLDLASYESVKAFAARATQTLARIDAVVENAGVAKTRWETAEGHELTITVNVISTFLLALLLLPKLKATAAREVGVEPRLSIVTSSVHGSTDLPEHRRGQNTTTFEVLDHQPASAAVMRRRYATSKLLEILVCRQLSPRLEGSGVILNFLSPGLCHSALGRESGWAFAAVKFLIARTTEVGSRTLVAAAAAGRESHGKYMRDGEVADGELSAFVRSADGDSAAEQVWTELSAILEEIQPGVTKNI
ncbi:hypothetical protein DV735_g3634, partial [Chaetothyriales sp. CBS 134920]